MIGLGSKKFQVQAPHPRGRRGQQQTEGSLTHSSQQDTSARLSSPPRIRRATCTPPIRELANSKNSHAHEYPAKLALTATPLLASTPIATGTERTRDALSQSDRVPQHHGEHTEEAQPQTRHERACPVHTVAALAVVGSLVLKRLCWF